MLNVIQTFIFLKKIFIFHNLLITFITFTFSNKFINFYFTK